MNHLFIGAHPDDIELACGGTILKLLSIAERVEMLVLTTGECRKGDRAGEQRDSFDFLGVFGNLRDFTDGSVLFRDDLVALIEGRLKNVDRIWTHCPEDLHQDHKAVSMATKAANRHKKADLVYYAPADITVPFDANLFVDITEFFAKKSELLDIFESQRDRHYIKTAKTGFSTDFADYVERFRIDFMTV